MNASSLPFARKPLATFVASVIVALATESALAGPGIAPGYSVHAAPPPAAPDIFLQTYFASSPQGLRPDLIGGAAAPGIDTGSALRKFVDVLPSVPGWAPSTNAGTGMIGTSAKYIPVAIPKAWPTDGADYYHLAVVEYQEAMHSDLPKATTLRGYVQIEEPGELPTPAGSKHIALHYPNGAAITLPDAAGVAQPVYGYDNPHYLGPTLAASKDKAVRIKYSNLLPAGAAVTDPVTGVVARNGDLFLPVDATLPGGALQQNRIDIHLHGGLTPWISDGNPHQWTIPVGDARFGNVTDAAIVAAGAGYSAAPLVTIDPPQSIAVATSVVTAGAVSALNTVNPGNFYTAATALVTIAPPPALGVVPVAAQATATALNGKLASVTLPAGGASVGYTAAPVVGVAAPTPSVNASAVATLSAAAGATTGYTLATLALPAAQANVGYATAPAVTIAPPPAAIAAAPVLSAGAADGVLAITNPVNYGYWAAPAAPVLTAPPAAVNALATSTVAPNAANGRSPAVNGITVNAGNFGYWSAVAPTVTVAAPVYTPVQATVATAGMNVNNNNGLVRGTPTFNATNAGYWNPAASNVAGSVVQVSAPPANVQATGTATTDATGAIVSIAFNANSGYWGSGAGITFTVAAPPAASRATASATVPAGGGLPTLTVGNAATNWGYFTAPNVTLTGGTHGAGTITATATVLNGRVTAVTYTGTATYTVAPTVTIANAPATARAAIGVNTNLNGSITTAAMQINNAGRGYAPNASVPITIGAPNVIPVQAVVTPTIGTGVNAGKITRLTLSTGGAGYLAPPTITIVPPVQNVTATAVPILGTGANAGKITGFTISGGANYTSAPLVTISNAIVGTRAVLTTAVDGLGGVTYALGNPGFGYAVPPALVAAAPVASVTATATATINATGNVTGYTINNVGTNYLAPNVPAVTVGAAPAAVQATVTASVSPVNGAITGYAVTNPGYGYWAAPAVTLPLPPLAVQATATANLGPKGAIGGFTITNPGQGYFTPPQVTIANPPGAIQATATLTSTAGALSKVVISNPGGGYTATPNFLITDATGRGASINGLISQPEGPSFRNVPDMEGLLAANAMPAFYTSPITGEGTLYYTNNQSSRMMWYHDHTSGLTRLNVYAGMAAPYLISDPTVDPVLPGQVLPAAPAALQGYVPGEQIPLVFQDKTFVPKDIAQQDSRWDAAHWGQFGDLWFPHVYETNQDPAQLRSASAVGRWDWGPWFAIIYPAQFALPTGKYGDVTTTPEAYQDTATVNGVAFPTVTVEPRAYRLRMLNAANDRFMNLGFYLADATQVAADGRTNVEVKAGANSATVGQPSQAGAAPNVFQAAGNGTLNPWPTDGRWAPLPTEMGPPMVQIGTDGGLLPNWVQVDPIPVNYDYNRRSVTVLNVSANNDVTQPCFPECHGLYLGPAERADVVVDFSQYAGKTLILYNDAPAPNPGYDPRIDYYTGNDPTNALNYATGGAPNTEVGYGPNTRTLMQVKVGALQTAASVDYTKAATLDPLTGRYVFDPSKLGAGKVLGKYTSQVPGVLQAAYAATQDKPIVGEADYNVALGQSYTNQYANLHLGSANEPVFYVTDAGPLTLTGVALGSTTAASNPSGVGTVGGNPNGGLGSGTGYTTAPAVVISPPSCAPAPAVCVQATATATVANGQVTGYTLTNPGAGYTAIPSVNVIASGSVAGLSVTAGGSGYSSVAPPAVTLTGGGGAGATATAVVNAAGVVTGLTITNAGTGYTSAPLVSIAPPAAFGGGATAGAVTMSAGGGSVATIALATPGSGYVTAPNVLIGAPPATTQASFVATVGVGGTVVLPATPSGLGYLPTPSPAPAVTIAAPANVTATASDTATIPGSVQGVYFGLVLNGITVSNTGAGYTAAPLVTISDVAGGAGTGALATATINAAGQVTGITVTNPGSGYTGPVSVTVAAPAGPFTPAAATAAVDPLTGAVTLTVSNPGAGYIAAPAVSVAAPPATVQATASAALVGGAVSTITVLNPGAGYLAAPTVTLSGGAGGGQATALAAVTGGGSGATAAAIASTTKVFAVPTTAPRAAGAVAVAMPPLPPGGVVGRLMNPAIQELFEPYYGRMNATLGIEMPFQSVAVQTTVPLNYVDPATESIEPNTLQMWKITHNGVDAHPVHFHLVNVQVVNRIGWDGTVKPPEDNELGWRETVKMNPLEDIVVVMKGSMPHTPFGIDRSVRAHDPSQPLGVIGGFTQVSTAGLSGINVPAGAPGIGQPATIVNAMENFDNEYIWHCHILGHEENDFMRPFVAASNPAATPAVSALVLSQAVAGGAVAASWVDPTTIAAGTFSAANAGGAYGNPANELGYLLQRSVNPAGPWQTVAQAPSNATSVADPLLSPLVSGTTYYYQVVGFNAAGSGLPSAAVPLVAK